MTGVKATKTNWLSFLKDEKGMHMKNRKKSGEPQHVASQQWDDVSAVFCCSCLSCFLQFIEDYQDGRRPPSSSSTSGGVQEPSICVFLNSVFADSNSQAEMECPGRCVRDWNKSALDLQKKKFISTLQLWCIYHAYVAEGSF